MDWPPARICGATSFPRLADQRRCLAPDLPLHGRTPGSGDQDFSLNGLAAFVEDFCAALELPSVDLVANDTGGAIAQVFAALRPERVATLTLTNCEAHDNLPPKGLLPAVLLARLGLLAPLGRLLLRNLARARERVYGSGFEDVTDERAEELAAAITRHWASSQRQEMAG